MAIKRVAILALAGVAFAQMDSMSGDMNSSSSMVAVDTSPAADNSAVATTATSGPMGSPMDSPIGVTIPPVTTTDTISAVPTSITDNMDYSSISADNSTSDTMAMADPSVTPSSSVMTEVTNMSSMTETGSMTTMDGMLMGTGGMTMPNTTATGQPISGNGVVNGVSIGLFLVSVALTALLQM
ncbi:hypothetical protein HD806DRAFT_481000 [Xylariaceae sp. AK1471]|nr:hypothetical protein HD806DRAFT_481000 [Xylariaceae sp. AK1471]